MNQEYTKDQIELIQNCFVDFSDEFLREMLNKYSSATENGNKKHYQIKKALLIESWNRGW